VLGDRPAGLTETVSRPGADDSVSHETFEAADHVNGPLPEIVMDWLGGSAVPVVSENLSCVVESEIVSAVTIMMLMESDPAADWTVNVTRPAGRVAGKNTEIA
jgi:hypothetical protein